MIASGVSTTSSGSGVEIEVMAFEAGPESFDFAFRDGSATAVDLVTRLGLLLKLRVDCWEDCEVAAVGALDFRRVAGMLAILRERTMEVRRLEINV